MESFIWKFKSNMISCVTKLNQHCRNYGYRWMTLRVEMGSVENGAEFTTACHTVNEDREQPGVQLMSANTACQEQNPVGRYIQTLQCWSIRTYWELQHEALLHLLWWTQWTRWRMSLHAEQHHKCNLRARPRTWVISLRLGLDVP